ncbi:MAG TPA: acyl-CoA dehydrogenase family protein [Stellaceae bacterium]|jgi:alkylation response protein AidB-like acyl-CoA dehydrogenase|nr:acyl-CoA dehydrogenase family protein [Stellaceae bacterium]
MDVSEARDDSRLSQAYLERARELKPMLAAAGDEIERGRQVTPAIVDAMIERGIFRMLLPRSIGGAELDPLTYTQVLYTLAQGDGSAAWCLGQNSGCSMVAPYCTAETAREVFGGPRGILAWGPDVPGAGRGVAVDGGYRLTGQWGFATGSRHASWLGCHISIYEEDGTPRLRPDGRPYVRTMLFPKSEARIIDNWQVLGLRGTGSDSYALKDHFVPQAHSAGRDQEQECREPGPLYRFTSGMIYAMSFSHCSMGIARGALDAFIEIARDKIPRGTKGTLRENNVIQSQVSQCEAKLHSARAWLRNVIGEMWDEAQTKGAISPEQHPQLRLASTWAINQAREIVATVYHAAGASAIFESNPLERRMRDIHAGTQQGQGRPQHFETVGQIMLGLPPEGRMFR